MRNNVIVINVNVHANEHLTNVTYSVHELTEVSERLAYVSVCLLVFLLHLPLNTHNPRALSATLWHNEHKNIVRQWNMT